MNPGSSLPIELKKPQGTVPRIEPTDDNDGRRATAASQGAPGRRNEEDAVDGVLRDRAAFRGHSAGCDCPDCLARQAGFDAFLATIGLAVFALVALLGFVELLRSGLLSW